MDEAQGSTFAYDEVPYPAALSPRTAPDRLGAVLKIRGLAAPDPQSFSYLEIGCGTGINSLAIAAAAPGARVVGFDLAAREVLQGRQLAEAAGLGNVDLHPGDILDYPRDGEKFDYIVAHGIYTWIPEHVREPLLELMAARLAPGGVAYIGYDALPTAGTKSALNRWLRAHTAHIADPVEKIDTAMGLAAILARHQRETSRFKPVLDQLVQEAPGYLRGYAYHDWLAEFYDPVSLPELARVAGRHGLGFVGTATLLDVFLSDLEPEGLALVAAAGDDIVARNVTVDLLRGVHSFRADLFVRADAPPAHRPGAWRELSFSYLGTAEPGEDNGIAAIRYQHDDLFAFIANPKWQKVMDCLIASAPNEVGFMEIAERTGIAVEDLDEIMRFTIVAQLVDRHASPQPFTIRPGERPRASRLARAQFAHEDQSPSLRHRRVHMKDGPQRLIVMLSDGTRTRRELAEQVSAVFEVNATENDIDMAIAAAARYRLFEA